MFDNDSSNKPAEDGKPQDTALLPAVDV